MKVATMVFDITIALNDAYPGAATVILFSRLAS